MIHRLPDSREKTARPLWCGALLGALLLSGVSVPVHAVSKEAQELMALREKHAPVNCELTKLSRQQNEALAAKNEARVRELTERMQALDKQVSPDKARMEELRKRVRGTPDYPAIMEQQLKFDRACKPTSRKP